LAFWTAPLLAVPDPVKGAPIVQNLTVEQMAFDKRLGSPVSLAKNSSIRSLLRSSPFFILK